MLFAQGIGFSQGRGRRTDRVCIVKVEFAFSYHGFGKLDLILHLFISCRKGVPMSAPRNMLNLTAHEANLSSLSVAIVSGSLAGNLCAWLLPNFSSLTVLLTIIGCVGYLVSSFVCQYLFKTAHAWYGSHTLRHRIYDIVAMGSAIGAFYV